MGDINERDCEYCGASPRKTHTAYCPNGGESGWDDNDDRPFTEPVSLIMDTYYNPPEPAPIPDFVAAKAPNKSLEDMIDDAGVAWENMKELPNGAWDFSEYRPMRDVIVDFVASKDAEIERLKQELLGLNMAYDILEARAKDIALRNNDLERSSAIVTQATIEDAVNEGYEAGKEGCLPSDVNTKVNRVYQLSMEKDTGVDFDTRWRIVLENLYMSAVLYRTEDKIAIPESDDTEARNAGSGIFF